MSKWSKIYFFVMTYVVFVIVEIFNGLTFHSRLACLEDVQFFQLDKDGNMHVFPPGSGCTGLPKPVQPGDELSFGQSSENVEDLSKSVTESFASDSIHSVVSLVMVLCLEFDHSTYH